MDTARTSTVIGVVIVRGGGAPLVQRRLPRFAEVSIGRRERHGLELSGDWVPLDLATFSPVAEGWIITNGQRGRMKVETDWIDVGHATYLPNGMAMLQRGEHRVTWPELDKPLSVALTVRTRRLEDQKIPYVVDSTIAGQPVPESGTYLGLQDAPMSSSLRYRLAVLFRHALEGDPEPLHLLKKRAEFLGIGEDVLLESAHRYRRRLNAVRNTDIDNLDELCDYLVVTTGELARSDLDP